jgi:hypothetical protein
VAGTRRAKRHIVQLEGVAADEIIARTRPRRESDPKASRLTIRPATLRDFSEDGQSLACTVRSALRVHLDEGTWEVRLVVRARFSASRRLTEEEAQSFASYSALYVVWPFVRAMVDETARMANVPAPLLPLIVRPGRTDVQHDQLQHP